MSMRRIVCASAIFAVVSAAVVGWSVTRSDPAAADTNVTQFKSDGESAYYNEYKSGDHYIYVYVSETKSSSAGSGSARSVYLQYYVYDYASNPDVYSYGAGTIDPGDFTASSNSSNATLVTDTADMTATYKYGPDIEFDLEWARNGIYSYESNGHTTLHTGGIKRITNGQVDYDYADASGSVGSYTVPGSGVNYTQGYIYTNKNVTITLDKD